LDEAYKYTFSALRDLPSKRFNSLAALKKCRDVLSQATITQRVAGIAALRNLRLYDEPGLIVIDLAHGEPRKGEGSFTCGCGETH